MGLSINGPITPYARSWAQQEAARLRPQYNVRPNAWAGRRMWYVERVHPDGSVIKVGSFETRHEAVAAARLLAGWRGDVTVCREG